MGRAKDLVEEVQIIRMPFQFQKPLFDDCEMLSRLLKKRVLKLCKIITHRYSRLQPFMRCFTQYARSFPSIRPEVPLRPNPYI